MAYRPLAMGGGWHGQLGRCSKYRHFIWVSVNVYNTTGSGNFVFVTYAVLRLNGESKGHY